MAVGLPTVFIVLLLCSPGTLQPPFKKRVHTKISKRSFAADIKACQEGFEWSNDKGLCLACGEGYYRSWCMSSCEKCAEPISSYDRLIRNCTVTRNSIVACKDDANAVAGVCTPIDAVKLDCNGAIDPLAESAARGQVTTETTQVAATARTRTYSGTTTRKYRFSQPFATGFESLQPSEVEHPPATSSSQDLTTVNEYARQKNVTDNPYKLAAVYCTTVVMLVGAMVAVPFMPCLVQIRYMD